MMEDNKAEKSAPLFEFSYRAGIGERIEKGCIDIVNGFLVYTGDMEVERFKELLGEHFGGRPRPIMSTPVSMGGSHGDELTIVARQGGPDVSLPRERNAPDIDEEQG